VLWVAPYGAWHVGVYASGGERAASGGGAAHQGQQLGAEGRMIENDAQRQPIQVLVSG
jgi:hypothetical protein